MAIEVGQLTKRHQEDSETSDPMNVRLVWRLSASSTPAYVSNSRATPERYVLLVLADGYQRPEPFDAALRRIVKRIKRDVNLAQLINADDKPVYRDLQIWSLYYPEFTDLAVRPGPPSSTFLERHFSELHMLSSPNIYPRTNELRRAIKKQHGLHVDKVLILANVTERGAGHTGGCLVVAGEYPGEPFELAPAHAVESATSQAVGTDGGGATQNEQEIDDGKYDGAYRLFLHEMGHAIGLGDEYFWEGVTIPGPPECADYPYPNVSKHQKPKGWETEGWPGAMYTNSAFRPAENCVMRDAEYVNPDGNIVWDSFCPVCRNQFRKFFILRRGGQSSDFSTDDPLIETVRDPGPFPLIPENQRLTLPKMAGKTSQTGQTGQTS